MESLFDYGVRRRLLRSVKALYKGGRARVKVQGMESQWFGVQKGVRWGCTMCHDFLMVYRQHGKRIKEGGGSVLR